MRLKSIPDHKFRFLNKIIARATMKGDRHMIPGNNINLPEVGHLNLFQPSLPRFNDCNC